MRIGELAAECGVSAKTVRFWESAGLLPDAARTPAGYRNYEPEAADRLRFIRHAQTAGLTLAEIRQVLAISDGGQPPCSHVAELIHEHLSELEHRISELSETRQRLERLASRAAAQDPGDCDGYCAILQPSESEEPSNPRAKECPRASAPARRVRVRRSHG